MGMEESDYSKGETYSLNLGVWERMENPYGELEGFMCECGHQSQSASHYCSNCGRKMTGGEKKVR